MPSARQPVAIADHLAARPRRRRAPVSIIDVTASIIVTTIIVVIGTVIIIIN